MAKRTIVQLVDDIDGKELSEGQGETVQFSLDGINYELDLSTENADKFRGVFQDYIAAGRRQGRKTGTAGKRTHSTNTKEIRDWARSQGMSVPDRGRLPKEVTDAWDAK